MDHVKLQKQNHFCQAWQSALAQHEGEERITSRVTPRVGRDSAGTGWQQLKMQVLSDFTERGGYVTWGIWDFVFLYHFSSHKSSVRCALAPSPGGYSSGERKRDFRSIRLCKCKLNSNFGFFFRLWRNTIASIHSCFLCAALSGIFISSGQRQCFEAEPAIRLHLYFYTCSVLVFLLVYLYS